MRKVAIIGIVTFATLIAVHGIVFTVRHETFPFWIHIIVYLFWLLIPTLSLLITQRYFKNKTYKYNSAAIVCFFLFFSLLGEGFNLYKSMFNPLLESEIFYREQRRVEKAVFRWIDSYAGYENSLKIKNINFGTISFSTSDLPTETIIMDDGKKVKAYYIYLEYYLKDNKENTQTEKNFFWVDTTYNVIGISMTNSFSIPVKERDIDIKYWLHKYQYEGP